MLNIGPLQFITNWRNVFSEKTWWQWVVWSSGQGVIKKIHALYGGCYQIVFYFPHTCFRRTIFYIKSCFKQRGIYTNKNITETTALSRDLLNLSCNAEPMFWELRKQINSTFPIALTNQSESIGICSSVVNANFHIFLADFN